MKNNNNNKKSIPITDKKVVKNLEIEFPCPKSLKSALIGIIYNYKNYKTLGDIFLSYTNINSGFNSQNYFIAFEQQIKRKRLKIFI